MSAKLLDFSKGDPLYPLTAVARHAFRAAAAGDLNHYYLPHSPFNDPRRPLLSDLAEYFKKRGFVKSSSIAFENIMITGGGTTEAYDLIVRTLAEDFKKHAQETGDPLKPVIIMPVPTYGFFFNSPRALGVETVFIKRDMDKGGRLDPEKLKTLLLNLKNEGKQAIAFYDSNPNNPLGHVRGREETAQIAQVIMEYNDIRRQHSNDLDNKRFQEIKRRGGDTKELLSIEYWSGPASSMRIIDDMVYDGLQYEGQQQPCGFAQIPGNAWGSPADLTFTIMGPSKAGLANLRAGIVISENDITALRNTQLSSSYSSTDLAAHAVHAFFSDREPFADMRKKHLKRMNAEHQFRGRLMKALIDGIGAVPDATQKDFRKMVRLLSKARNMSPAQARARLQRGIDGITVTTTPQAGFFHLLDFSGLKDRIYLHKATTCYGEEKAPVPLPFKGCDDIKNVFGTAAIGFAYADWMGMDSKEPVVRATFAETPENIIALAYRLEDQATNRLSPAAARKEADIKP